MGNKPARDWVYLGIIGLQLIGMLGTLGAFSPCQPSCHRL